MPCRKGFFLPLRVLSSLFKKKFLSYLKQAVHQGKLSFHGDMKRLADQRQWTRSRGSCQAALLPRAGYTLTAAQAHNAQQFDNCALPLRKALQEWCIS